jgi:hypothetical protein
VLPIKPPGRDDALAIVYRNRVDLIVGERLLVTPHAAWSSSEGVSDARRLAVEERCSICAKVSYAISPTLRLEPALSTERLEAGQPRASSASRQSEPSPTPAPAPCGPRASKAWLLFHLGKGGGSSMRTWTKSQPSPRPRPRRLLCPRRSPVTRCRRPRCCRAS